MELECDMLDAPYIHSTNRCYDCKKTFFTGEIRFRLTNKNNNKEIKDISDNEIY